MTDFAAASAYTPGTEPVAGDPYTQPYYPSVPATGAANQGVDYVVVDDGAETPGTLGSGAPIAFILILLLALMVAAAVVILTIGKKKEDESEA